jgi:hypothetical protein
MDRGLGGPQTWSGHRGWRKKSFASAGDRTPVPSVAIQKKKEFYIVKDVYFSLFSSVELI